MIMLNRRVLFYSSPDQDCLQMLSIKFFALRFTR